MSLAEPADVLEVGFASGEHSVSIDYRIDDLFSGRLRVEFPFSLASDDEIIFPSLALGASVFLSQFCLAKTVICNFPCNDDMVSAMLPIAELLYDVRCYKDRRPLQAPPKFTVTRRCQPRTFSVRSSRHACVLWSGGIDSTLCILALQRNGYTLSPIHATVNSGSVAEEEDAVTQLSQALSLPFLKLSVDFPQQLEIGRYYSRAFDVYPYENAIPFGRDLLLVLIASIVAKKVSADTLCLGGDYDGRHRYLPYQGKLIARHDMEAAHACDLLQDYLRRFVSPSLRLFPPLAQLTKYRIVFEMLSNHADLVDKTSFCFHGEPCGRCFKCVVYYAFQRALQKDVIRFRTDPVRENEQELREYVDEWSNRNLLCADAMHYSLSKIVERDDIGPDDHLLRQYRQVAYGHFRDRLAAIEKDLMTVRADAIVPQDFRVLP